jgi:glycosyltransferase involved in cell wall biosynthesis
MIDLHIDGIVFAEVPLGGISRMWQNLITRFSKRGCRVSLYLPHEAKASIEFPSEVKRISYPKKISLRPGRFFSPMTEMLFDQAMHRMWSKPSTGIFQSTHFTTSSALRIPQVLTVHDLFHECLPDCFSQGQASKLVERRRACVAAAKYIACDSIHTRTDVEKVFCESRAELRTVWLAADPLFRRMSTDELSCCVFRAPVTKPFLLYVGTRYPYKNFAGLLSGFAAWERRGEFQLLVIGAEPTPAECAMLRAFAIEDQVVFHSACDEELVLAYNFASAVVVPSISEGFGLPVWEAMACGTPVVASRGGSLPEIGGETAFYFGFGSPQELACVIEEAVSFGRESERVEKGIALASARTWDDVADEYLAIYRDVLGL